MSELVDDKTPSVKWPIRFDRVKARPEGKKGSFVAHFERNGHHEKRALKTTRRNIAYKAALKLEGELSENAYTPRPKKIMVTEAADKFIAHKKAENISSKTEAKYVSELNTFAAFAANENALYLSQLSPGSLASYKLYRRTTRLIGHSNTPKELHEKTLFLSLMIVKGFLAWCKRSKLLASNPAEELRVAKPVMLPKFAPDLEVVDRLLEAAAEPRITQIAVLAFTGMRSGEMQLLRPQDIDTPNNWILVQTLKAKLSRVRPVRKVPIHPRLLPYLIAHLNKNKAQRFLFCAEPSRKYPKGDHCLNTKHLNEYFQNLGRKLEMAVGRSVDGLVIHSLRHFFETHCHNQNVPQRAIDTWLGHTGDKSMGSVYYKLTDGDSQNLMTKINFGQSHVGGAAEGSN